MKLQGVHHLAIQVKDLDRCGAFYRDVLGLRELTRHRRADGSVRSVWLALGPSDVPFLALEHCDGEGEDDEPFRRARPGFLLVALRIAASERAGVLRTLEAHHVRVAHQTRWTVYVRDPEGNRVAFSHYPEDPLG